MYLKGKNKGTPKDLGLFEFYLSELLTKFKKTSVHPTPCNPSNFLLARIPKVIKPSLKIIFFNGKYHYKIS